ncbi:YcaO-like family protein [Legionella dresdenensis]|uniref:YcaO-like family protein n=1 Tax=Legionella dresdenensis TaxID=450200 RepID=A0ABV8CFK0_9GAMM
MISVAKNYSSIDVESTTRNLMERMLNPICGLVQEIGFIKRSKFGPRIMTAGADITGVHTLLNREDPGRGAYHTGGTGVYLNEPIIKSLGETIERYSQLVAELNIKNEQLFASYDHMIGHYDNVLSSAYLDLYSNEQLAKTSFPYNKFDKTLPLTWVKTTILNAGQPMWIPAQFLFVGYHVKKHSNEPWYSTAVTTGTAAHTDQASVLLNSILEIIQVDSAMGHWYSDYEAPEIILDSRTAPMQALLHKYDNLKQNTVRFFWLRSPDLLGHSIACVLEKPENSIPRVSVGLGASTSLNDALYKAYLEAVGVSNLGNILILKDKIYNNLSDIDPRTIYDIDSNVAMYGKGYFSEIMFKKFNCRNAVTASEISEDIKGTKKEQLIKLLDSFYSSGKSLAFVDLTNLEAQQLGFFVSRLWCKDTLSLCFPSAPPMLHPRFNAYGGFSHSFPHPYP